HLEDGAGIDAALRRVLAARARVDRLADAAVVRLDRRRARPVGGQLVRQPAADRIDAEGKQAVEGLVERLEAESLARDQVPVERLDVAEVEDQAVTLGDR